MNIIERLTALALVAATAAVVSTAFAAVNTAEPENVDQAVVMQIFPQ
ncbi:hypothetical protein [Propylenella binzhouense]|nr:hypothetical protein [Propylenella binzhouense]